MSSQTKNESEDFTKLKEFENDMLESGKDYAITIAPDDQHQYFDHDSRLKMFYEYYKKKINKLHCSSKVIMFLECTNPKDTRSRLHLHGVLNFTDIGVYKFYIYHWNALVKTAKVKVYPIKNDTTWYNYITKNLRTMKGLSKYYNIDCPIFNFYPEYINARTKKTVSDQTVCQESIEQES